MAKIKTNWGPLEAIMIDGYMPTHSQLKQVDWQGLKKSDKIPEYDFYRIDEYLHLANLPNQRLLGIFTRSMFHIIGNFRSSIEIERRKGKPSSYIGFTTGKKVRSIENYENSRKYREFLPLLITEYRAEKENSCRYIQNVVVCFPNCHLWDHKKYMKELEKYFVHSLKELHFKEKENYKDFNTFKKAWEGILIKLLKELYSDGCFT